VLARILLNRDLGGMKENDHADWYAADARVLGQILAAQNVVLALPDADCVAEFYVQTLQSIPGVQGCRVCLNGRSVQLGTMNDSCSAESPCCGHSWGESADAPSASTNCKLAGTPSVTAIEVGSSTNHWGYFVLQSDSLDQVTIYRPFLHNLASYVSLILENRRQRRLLETGQYELERKVAERAHDLIRANEALQREINEHRQAEEKAQQLSERLTLAAQAAHIGVWDWDLRTNELVWDETMYELYGAVPTNAIKDRWAIFWNSIHPDDRPAMETLCERAPREAGTLASEVRVVWPDGSLRVLELHAQVIRDRNGQPIRMTGINVDITERKHAAEEVIRLNRELEQRVLERTAELAAANKELDSFAYSVSHDLRAPLRHVEGFLALLRQKIQANLDEQSQRYMSIILEANRRMARLIDDLLSFSRMARQNVAKTSVNLGTLVREVIHDLEPDTRGRAIDWQIDELPVVTADAALLRSVLFNLLSNAHKFTRPRERACIAVGCAPSQAGEIAIFVRDNGVGFDPRYSAKLFGVFQRLHRADDFEGTGIGLANVRRIIDRHGGRTWAEGRPDEGATFYFSLPR
jgi:PAS domain S-box-containing protein